MPQNTPTELGVTELPEEWALSRLGRIQSQASEVFYRMEHLELDKLFTELPLVEISHLKIRGALLADATWLAEMLGIPDQVEKIISDFQRLVIARN